MALPELMNDDAIAEILTRLPPDDPARLQRFALVCKSWCRILSDTAFHRRHRAYHRTPLLFGFFRGRRGPGATYRHSYMLDFNTRRIKKIGDGNISSCIFPFMFMG